MAPALELSLRDRAVNAFKVGNAPRAYGLYQAHLLSAPADELESAMQNLRWDKKRIVPRLGYSFAVGLVVNNPGKVESLKPIGTDLEGLRGSPGAGGGRSAGGRGAGGGPGFGGFGAPGGSGNPNLPALPARELSDAAGKFATKFVEAFGKAHSDGKWSEAFREYEFGSSLTLPTNLGGVASGLAGALGSRGSSGPAGTPPAGYAGAGGPPPGYGGGQGGPPAGYGGQGGPPAGYAGGASGAPPGYGGAQGGPPAGYRGGAGAGAPPGYGGGQGGPPAGYSGGSNAGAPPGYGGAGGAPSGGQPPAGQGNSGQSVDDRVDYVAPQDDASGLAGGIGAAPPGAPPPPGAAAGGRPSFGAPGAGAPGFGAPGFGGPASGNAANAAAAALDPEMAKDLQLPADTIPLSSGLNYIGKGESVGELTKKAVEQGYDALIVFEVDVSFVRVNGTIKNDCRIRTITLKGEMDAKEKTITSSLLNNRDVAADKDPDARVDTAVDIFMKKMIEAYPMDDLPNFKSESIQGRRLKDLVNDKARSKLDLLCEVELYASRGLVDSTLKEAAFERIAGSDGKTLATSEPEDRIPILEKMVRRQFE
jgi:hypothetical protein